MSKDLNSKDISSTNIASAASETSSFKLYWRLLAYLKPNILLAFLVMVGYSLYAYSGPLMGKLMERVANAFDSGDINASITIPIFVLYIYFVRGIGLFMGNYFVAMVAQNVVHVLRVQLFERLMVLPSAYFDQNNSGQLISKITYNVAQVTAAVTDALKIFIREGLSVVALVVYMFVIDWQLTLIFMVITPVIGTIVVMVGKRLRRLSSKVQTAMGNITSICAEMIGGYRVVRMFGGEKYEKRRFEKASHSTRRQNLKIVLTTNLALSVNQFLVAAVLAVMVFVALRYSGFADSASFLAYLTLAGLIPKSAKQLGDVWGKIQKGLAAADTIFAQLDELPERDQGTFVAPRVNGAIEIKNLSFAYPASDNSSTNNSSTIKSSANKPVLTDINLQINTGETVALVGRSGSGKSTLVSLIPRYYDSDNGEILIDGQDTKIFTLNSLRQQIALVTQDVVLFNDTVRNNIAYGDLANKSEEEIKAAAQNAYALDFINELPEGFDTEIGEDGSRLSGGQRQRLSIARALLKDAPILILDEATSALDTESERLFQAALENVMKDRTTLVIAHRLSTIENADKIVVMDEGKIVEQGSHAELIQCNGYYAKLHAMQFKEEDNLASTPDNNVAMAETTGMAK